MKDQLPSDVIWSVFEKVSKTNSRFNPLDTLVVTLHSVKMTDGYGKHASRARAERSALWTITKKYRRSQGRRQLPIPRVNNSNCEVIEGIKLRIIH